MPKFRPHATNCQLPSVLMAPPETPPKPPPPLSRYCWAKLPPTAFRDASWAVELCRSVKYVPPPSFTLPFVKLLVFSHSVNV